MPVSKEVIPMRRFDATDIRRLRRDSLNLLSSDLCRQFPETHALYETIINECVQGALKGDRIVSVLIPSNVDIRAVYSVYGYVLALFQNVSFTGSVLEIHL